MRLFPAPNGSAGRQIKPAARGSRKPEICGHDRAVSTGDSLIISFQRSLWHTTGWNRRASSNANALHAAQQLTKHREAERELLEKWISVAEYQ